MTAVWVDASTDRAALSNFDRSRGPIVAIPLPDSSIAEVIDLQQIDGIYLRELSTKDNYGLGVPSGARPDSFASIEADSICGGCPVVEQGALFFGTDGQRFACQRHLLKQMPLQQLGEHTSGATLDEKWFRLRHDLRLDQREAASSICASCSMSFAEWIDQDQLRVIWLRKRKPVKWSILSSGNIFLVAPYRHHIEFSRWI